MAHRIEIALKRGLPDPRGRKVAERAQSLCHLAVTGCETRDVYKIDTPLNKTELQAVRKAFTDPVTSLSSIGRHRPPAAFDWVVEVGFKPGVTDNVGRTAKVLVEEVIDRSLGEYEQVYTSIQYFLKAPTLAADDVTRLANDQLANPLIQTVDVHAGLDWASVEPRESVPKMPEEVSVQVQTYNLEVSDDDLMQISREGILALNLAEMHAVRDYYRRPDVRAARTACDLPMHPTDVELECIAQTWSEHCSHKIFAAKVQYTDAEGNQETIDSLFKTYIKGSTHAIAQHIDWLVSVFTDNAGIIRFNDTFHLAFKVETHNTPSALDPYGGSMTGIVGCNRDPMGTGMGCELLYNTWGYCLGSPFYDGKLPEGLLHPRRIRDGVHEGVIDGGNQSGIPWARGFERFDARFLGKPLVFCGTVGKLPVDVSGGPSERKEVSLGDRLVVVGGRIGKDGIHGATFSSEELHHHSPAQAVQIGDPITQRKAYEFLVEARDAGLFRCITDNGAGGLSCSAGEMGLYAGGVDVDLTNAPLKYEGLQPWEILLSEAQERMTLAVPPEDVDALLALARHRDVEATDLGSFNDSGLYTIRHQGRVVGQLHMDFLYDGCPQMDIEARWSSPNPAAPEPPKAGSRNKTLKNMLARLNITSGEYRTRMYDGEVKGLSVVKPWVGVESDMPADATVLLADHGSNEGVALSEGINPFYSEIDTYHMVTSVVDEAVRRIVAVGASPDRIAGLDNFCWPDPVASKSNPDGAYKMAQLVRANQALYDITTAYRVPCISGKDSMKNDSVRGGKRISIPPTLLFSAIGKMDDVTQAVTPCLKQAGDIVWVAGTTFDELGGSEWCRMLAEEQGLPENVGSAVPRVSTDDAMRLYRTMFQAMQHGWIRSCTSPGIGGLAVAATQAALGGGLGLELNVGNLPQADGLHDDQLLFSESNSRFLFTCSPSDSDTVEEHFAGLPVAQVGRVVESPRLHARGKRRKDLLNVDLSSLRRAFKETLHGC